MRSFFAHPKFPALLGMTFAVLTAISLLAVGTVAHSGAFRRARVTACANNLGQLWRMQNVYMSQFGGHGMRTMPPTTGSAFWKVLTTNQPPLIDETVNDIFLCPVKGTSVSDECDYAGPAKRIGLLLDGDPVGADLPDNHSDGPNDEGGGNVLRKSGDVIEVTGPDWRKLTTDPLFPIR